MRLAASPIDRLWQRIITIFLEISFDIHLATVKSERMNIDLIASRLEALGNPTRLGIYRHLVRAGPEGLAVGDVQELVGVPRSTLSHHLHKLIAVDLVTQERQGTTLICRAEFDVMHATMGFLESECCADAIRRCDAA
jgi:DNA-binding transcriptional ArsR family regulator